MIRNDFVSNSSSSSYIVSSKLNENELFDYLINEYCSDDQIDTKSWFNTIVKQNIYLLPLSFIKICRDENQNHIIYSCYEFIIPRTCIDEYIDDDLNIKVTPQDFLKQFETTENEYVDDCGQLINSKYAELDIPNTAIITNKTIAFTKWFLDNCCYNDQIYKNLVNDNKNFVSTDKTQIKNFEEYLFETYSDKAFIDTEQRKYITEQLFMLENSINNNKTCYIVKFGYSGEGCGPWIYTNKNLKDNDIVQFHDFESY
jgi:hypothetical protein